MRCKYETALGNRRVFHQSGLFERKYYFLSFSLFDAKETSLAGANGTIKRTKIMALQPRCRQSLSIAKHILRFSLFQLAVGLFPRRKSLFRDLSVKMKYEIMRK